MTVHEAADALRKRPEVKQLLSAHQILAAVQAGILPFRMRTVGNKPPQYTVQLREVEEFIERIRFDEVNGNIIPEYAQILYKPESRPKSRVSEGQLAEGEVRRRLEEVREQRWLREQQSEVWE